MQNWTGLLGDTGVIKKKKFATSLIDDSEDNPEADMTDAIVKPSPADAMKGLLGGYSADEMNARKQQAFFSAMLKASGPSALPVGFGQVLGAGMEASMQAGDSYRNDAAKNEYMTGRLSGMGGNSPAAMQMAQEEARLLAAGDFEGATRLRAYAKTADVQNEYSKGMTKDANGNFIAAPGYAGAAGDIAGAKKKAEKLGEGAAAFEQNYPTQTAKNNYAVKLIDDLVGSADGSVPEHPGLRGAVGLSSMIPNRAGGNAKDFENRLAQIGGQQFLQAFESLKGGGQITEIEGTKATNAIARMQASNSESEFIAGAREFQGIIRDAQNRANQRAGGASPSLNIKPRMRYNPATGEFE